jgi:ABC-2 type transport system permease protein
MKALRYMLVANLKMNVRNRTALFWNLAFPLLFILLFGFLFSEDDVTIDVGIAGADSSPLAQQVAAEMRASDGFSVTIGSAEEQLTALDEGDRTVVVLFTPGRTPDRVEAEILWNQTNPQLGAVAVSAVRQFLTDAGVAMAGGQLPVEVTVRSVDTNDLRYMDFLVPGILGMSVMNSGMIGLASAFVTYRERGILRRIRATPFPLYSFIAARIASQVVISVVQAVVLIVTGLLLVGLTINGNLLYVLVMVVVGALAFLALGFVVASVAPNQAAADSLANGISFPMMFLSGVFFPVDAAPAWLQAITHLMPLRYFVNALRDLMVRDATLPEQWLNILILLATGVIALLVSMRFFRWETRPA